MSAARRALVLSLILLLVGIVPGNAAAKARPKDRVRPVSTIETEDGAVLVPAPVQAGPLEPLTTVHGSSADRGSGVELVNVTYIRDVEGVGFAMIAFHGWLIGCDRTPKVCRWAAPVPGPEAHPFFVLFTAPIEYVLFTPGEWHVVVTAIDGAGNIERRGPEIDVLVV